MRLIFRDGFIQSLIVILLLTGCGSEREKTQSNDVALPAKKAASEPIQSTQQRLQAASRLVEAGAMDQAEQAIRELLIENPDNLPANSLMLRVMLHSEDIAGAISILDRMAELNPARRDDMEAHAANLRYRSGDAEDAITRLESLIERSPGFDEARRLLAQVWNQQGYTFDANEQIRKLIGHTLMSRDELISLIFPTRSWVAMKEIEAKSDQERRRLGTMSVATAYRIEGNPREALECLDDSELIAQKRDPAAIALYGRTLASAQMYDELATWIASAPIQCERYPDYWIACGTLAIRKDDEAAVACFAEAIRREPHSMDAHYGLIESLETVGQMNLAERFRQRSHALDAINRQVKEIRESPNPKAQAFNDVALQLMSIGRPIEAIAWQQLALSRFSPNSEQMKRVPTYKSRVLSELPSGRDEGIILCEMDLTRFVPVQDWLATQRQLATKRLAAPTAGRTETYRPELPLIVPVFRNVAGQVGMEFRYQNASSPVERDFQIFQAYGGGVACIDFDRDGSVDLYFGQAATEPPDGIAAEPNGLFRNLGGRFLNVISEARADDRGYTVGVSAGDWNQDGFADLLIGNLGPNRLLINQGDGTFRLCVDDSLANHSTYTSSVAIADVTGDALPDIVEVNYLDDPAIFDPIEYGADGKPVSLPGPLQFQPAMDRLLVSAGDGSMLAQPLGGQDQGGFRTGLALLVTDLDGAPDNEVFVANDLTANQLWIRRDSDDTAPAWMDTAVANGVAYGNLGKPMACMGIAAADFDGNGLLDLHVTNFENEWSNHYMQTKSGSFVDSTVSFKLDTISHQMLGFGVQAIDYDNNAAWDLIVGNGHIEDLTAKGSLFAMPTQLLVGRRDGFLEQKVSGDDQYWNAMHFSRAMAKCDFNLDGRIDVVVTDLKRDAVLLENQTPTANHWLQLELVGTRSERDAIGARVTAEFASPSIVQTVQTGDGYLSKNESAMFFGLGPSKSVQRLRVRWPSGAEQVFEDLTGDARWLLVEGDPNPWSL